MYDLIKFGKNSEEGHVDSAKKPQIMIKAPNTIFVLFKEFSNFRKYISDEKNGEEGSKKIRSGFHNTILKIVVQISATI